MCRRREDDDLEVGVAVVEKKERIDNEEEGDERIG